MKNKFKLKYIFTYKVYSSEWIYNGKRYNIW